MDKLNALNILASSLNHSEVLKDANNVAEGIAGLSRMNYDETFTEGLEVISDDPRLIVDINSIRMKSRLLAGVKKVIGDFSIKFTEAIYDPMEFKVRGVPHFDDGEYFGIICYWENLDGVHNNISAGTVSSTEGRDALVFSVSLPSPGDYVLHVVGVAIE